MDAQPHRGWWRYGLLIAVAALLTWLAFRGQDMGAIIEDISEANPTWILLSLALTSLGHVSRARRWQLLLRASEQEARLTAVLSALMVGYLSSLGLPRLGEITRCASLARLNRGHILAIGGTVVAERVADLLALASLTLIGMASAGPQVTGFWQDHISGPLQSLLSPTFLLKLAAAMLGIGLLAWLAWERTSMGERLRQRLRDWARALSQGLLSIRRMPRPWEFVLHTVLVWLSYYSAPFCSIMALGLGQGHPWTLAFYVFMFGSLARTIPLPAGSMGAYHLLLSQLMVALGYTATQGLTLATLNHATQTLFYLVAGVLATIAYLQMARRMEQSPG